MLKKCSEILSGIPATVLSGVLLLSHFILKRAGVPVPVDPAWFAVFIGGIPILFQALEQLVRGRGIKRLSSSLLIIIAMTAAVWIGDLFAAGEVAVIMAIGNILETRTADRAKKDVSKLLRLAPAMGRRITDAGEEMVPAEEIRKGDRLRVLPGEAFPADGEIVEGETSVDQAILTGESLPVDKSVGDPVFCGTVNRFGAVDIRAVNVGEDSSLRKIARLVQSADEQKAPTARTVDKYAAWMVPSSLLIAAVVFLLTRDTTRAVTVLLVFCPCALTLATPTAVIAAIGQATKKGVIIKSGEALEAMGRADLVAFDKTGTLTCGDLEVSDILSFREGLDENGLLSLAAAAESRSEHPLGRAIVACAKRRDMELPDSEGFSMTAGRGIRAEVDGAGYFCGSEAYLREQGISLPAAAREAAEKLQAQGKAMILVGTAGICVGLIALSDTIRPAAGEMVSALSAMDTDVVLLTGDTRQAASYLADQVGIRSVQAQLLPEEKASCITRLQEEGSRVCMIGDGVNDAAALKTASVGVAMGSIGSDIAVEAADITLMRDDIAQVPYLKQLSEATVRTIKVSITAAMTINLIALILSLFGVLGTASGALVHNIGSCLVVLFAGLLYDREFTGGKDGEKRKARGIFPRRLGDDKQGNK